MKQMSLRLLKSKNDAIREKLKEEKDFLHRLSTEQNKFVKIINKKFYDLKKKIEKD
jgi:hypothetical protein